MTDPHTQPDARDRLIQAGALSPFGRRAQLLPVIDRMPTRKSLPSN